MSNFLFRALNNVDPKYNEVSLEITNDQEKMNVAGTLIMSKDEWRQFKEMILRTKIKTADD